MAEAPKLFFEEPETIITRVIARYAQEVDRPVETQQVEAILLRSIVYELVLHRATGDIAASQLLSAFANGVMLDYLANNVGVTRLASTPAVTDLEFTLVPGHGTVTIPAGTKVRSQDGLMVFETDMEVSAAPGTDTLTVSSTAQTDGPQGNSYAIGLISDIIDAQPFVMSASNTYVTGGGADIETDEGLRRRIPAAQNQNGTAGSADAYRFWALSANPSIIDVAVVSPKDGEGDSIGGQVILYPLVPGGISTPQAILDAVEDAVSGETRRPLTDNVSVVSPTKLEYVIPFELVLMHGAVQSTTEAAVLAGIAAYANKQSQKLGADITEAQIIAAGMTPDVYAIRLPGFTDIVVSLTEFAVCTEINKISVTYEDINA